MVANGRGGTAMTSAANLNKSAGQHLAAAVLLLRKHADNDSLPRAVALKLRRLGIVAEVLMESVIKAEQQAGLVKSTTTAALSVASRIVTGPPNTLPPRKLGSR
jgi:hypothetical protein